MISSNDNRLPVVQVQMPPAIHVHPPKQEITIVPSEVKQTINVEAAPAQVAINPTINVSPAEVMLHMGEPHSYRLDAERGPDGRIKFPIFITPLK